MHILHPQNLKLLPLLPLLYIDAKKVRRQTPVLPPAQKPQGESGKDNHHSVHLLIVGESTMAGLGVETHEEGFPGHLASTISKMTHKNVKWEVKAQSGYTVNQINSEIVDHISDGYDLIVIGVGGNDAFTLNTTQGWRKHVKVLIDKLLNSNPRAILLFINMPPIHAFPGFTPLLQKILGQRVEVLGQELNRIVQTHKNVYYIDKKIDLLEWQHMFDETYTIADFFSDGVHPSKLTYRTWAEEVAKYIIDQQLIK